MNETRIGHYTIVEKLGAGGMGDVYRAQDSRLGRDVALKTLPGLGRGDSARLARFRREARLLAALAHPGIAPVFDVGESDGTPFLVMELVPGETLAARLERGPLPVPAAIETARQVALALDAAHAKGIVHRDLKPMNVMVRPDGRISVVDFGLGKGPDDSPDASGAATMDVGRTQEGTVLGTPGYMSPEQVRGEAAGPAADVWALACVLFEAVTGAKAYPGATLLEAAGAVLHAEPEWQRLPSGVPAPVRAAVRDALAKEPARRPSMRVFAERLAPEAAGPARVDPGPRGGWMSRLLGSLRRPARVDAVEPAPAAANPRFVQVTFDEGLEEFPAWAPDGRRIVYAREVGRVRHLYVRDLDTGAAHGITSGDHDDIQPSWSPDGTRIAFVRHPTPGQRLEPGDVFGAYEGADVWSLDPETGHAVRILDGAASPSFSPDGRRIAVDAARGGPRRIWLVGPEGQNPTQLTSDDSEAVVHINPRWSPDGRRLVFQNVERTKFDIRCIEVESRRQTWLTRDPFQDMHPVFGGGGDSVYFTSAYRGGGLNIWKVPVTASGEPGGPLRQITTGPGQDVELAVSRDGRRLCYSVHRQNAELWKLPVSPSGRPAGEPVKVVASSREDSRGVYSPDGSRLAFNSNRTGDMNLWLLEVDGNAVRQLTRGAGGDYQPAWSPDGRRLAFFSARDGNPAVWCLDLAGGAPVRLTAGSGIDVNPAFSPDGRSIAYQSDAGGRLEVWVMAADGSAPRQLTHVGCAGHFLCWSRDGRWIVFKSPGAPGSGVMRVPVDGGRPEPLPTVKGGAHLSLSPDGARVMDVVGHKTLWVSPLDGAEPERVYEFADADSRIDYPTWSPDGTCILFDRFRPRGADIWIVEDFA